VAKGADNVSTWSAAAGFLLILSLSAQAGPFDEVGKAIDKATQDVGKAAEKAAQDAGKAVEKAAQDTGKTIDKGVQDTGQAVEKATQDAQRVLMEKVLAQRSTESILSQLAKLPLDKLYSLKVSPDICGSGTVNCEVLPNDRVRQFVDVEIDRRKAALDVEDKSRSFFISLGSLVVSCFAFGLGVVGLVRTRKEP
jgi:hypothetical protein